jgi:hypothetical protein
MLPGMGNSRLARRAFVVLGCRALLGAGLLAVALPKAARGGSADPNVFTGQDILDRLLALAHERAWKDLPIGERIGAIGMALRRTPYAVDTLELHEDREVCSVNLGGMDCVTFFENALALARLLGRGGGDPHALLAEVSFARYRGGRLTDYASRLHYTSDWFFDNEAKGVVRQITRELPGAVRFTKRVDYMSTHPEAYRQLRANPDLVAKIALIEAQINAREIAYVPKERVAQAQSRLMTGDIIGITTARAGLDCAHTGLCYRHEGVSRFLHASTTEKAVILDQDLATYLASVPSHTGIMAARPLEVT